jgi:hypothetical protein
MNITKGMFYSMSEFDPKNCPIGLLHEHELKHTRDLLNMAIERIEERIETFKEGVDEHFASVDKRFDALEKQVARIKSDIPEIVDNRIKDNNGMKALSIVKWVLFTVGGSILITLLTKLALQTFNLG